KDLVLDWKLERNLNDFASEEFTILFDGTKFDVKYLGEKYIKFNLIEEENQTKLVITEAYKVEDMILLSYESITGQDGNVEISIKDIGGLSNIIKSEVSLSFSYKRWLRGYKKVYNANVPVEALSINQDRIIIKVGKLGMKARALHKKKKVR